MFVVLKAFVDAQDNNHIYSVGDVFPRHGFDVSDDRLEELSSNRNNYGTAFIINENPGEASSQPEEDAKEVETGVSPSKTPEAKRRPKKRKEK